MEERLNYVSGQLITAIADFDRALSIDDAALDPVLIDVVHNGQAQKFEFTVELFWKATKVFLHEQHGFDLASPKSVVKKYFELGYVDYDDSERLLTALDMRNSLSHVYNKEGFLALYEGIRSYRGFFSRVASGLRAE